MDGAWPTRSGAGSCVAGLFAMLAGNASSFHGSYIICGAVVAVSLRAAESVKKDAGIPASFLRTSRTIKSRMEADEYDTDSCGTCNILLWRKPSGNFQGYVLYHRYGLEAGTVERCVKSKTTLLKLLMGLEEYEGRIVFAGGLPVFSFPDRDRSRRDDL